MGVILFNGMTAERYFSVWLLRGIFFLCLPSACEIRVSGAQKISTVARVKACYVACSKHVLSHRKCFMLKEAAGTVSQPVHFGFIRLGAFWSFEIFWYMLSPMMAILWACRNNWVLWIAESVWITESVRISKSGLDVVHRNHSWT